MRLKALFINLDSIFALNLVNVGTPRGGWGGGGQLKLFAPGVTKKKHRKSRKKKLIDNKSVIL